MEPESLVTDKRVGQEIEPLAARFAAWARRFPSGWSAEELGIVRMRAEELEAVVCAMAGAPAPDVRRLRWTSAAIRAARAGGGARRAPGGPA